MPGPAWIVLPTYCEAANVAAMVHALRAAAPAGTRILIVDDDSPDGTGAIADELAATDPGVSVLHRPAKTGLGRAYVAGFGHALAHGAGRVLEIDCDFSHDPADVPRLLAAAQDADVVLGSRYVEGGRVEGWHWWRRLVSRAGCAYARVILRAPVRDLTGGLKCFSADALRTLGYADAGAEGYAFQIELTYRALCSGLRVVELPITFRERREGESKLTGRIALEAVWRVPALRVRAIRRRNYTF